jgi:hypothetical protein
MPARTSSITTWRPCRGSTRACGRRRITGSRSTCWLSRGASRRRDLTKSGFMVGLGETEDEVHALLRDLRAAGADVATIGQYLQPTRRNLPVAEYVDPRAVRPLSRLRPGARIQDGVQRPAGAQFLHGGRSQRTGAARPVLNWLLALALGGAPGLAFPAIRSGLAGARGAHAAAGGGGARAAAVAPLPAGLGCGRGLLVRRLLLDPVRALVHGGMGNAAGLGDVHAVLRGQGAAHGVFALLAGS